MINYTLQIPTAGHMAKGGLRPVAIVGAAFSASVTADRHTERTP